MLKIGILVVKPDQIQICRDWFAKLMQRQEEVRETFLQETVRQEQVYLLDIGDETILVYAMEVEHLDRGREAFRNSTLPIDIEHRRVMKQILTGQKPAELIYECAVGEQPLKSFSKGRDHSIKRRGHSWN